MSLEFYLFDVDHGQSAALRLPDGRWCLFDIGRTDSFSPTKFIRQISGRGEQFRYYKGTVSHWHGDHLDDHDEFLKAGPEFMRTVAVDDEFIRDVQKSSADGSFEKICTFRNHYIKNYTITNTANYGPFVGIQELSLPVGVARSVSSSSNSAVNNASVVSRISYYGHSILICGDMEAEGWDFALNHSSEMALWRQLVANVSVMVAPHHGHATAFSTDLMRLANPGVVIVSVRSGDDHVDSRYSAIQGITIGNEEYKMISTRQKGTLKIAVNPGQTLLSPASVFWWFDADGRKAETQRLFESLYRPTLLTPGISAFGNKF
jgi:beta-lactamase superfamily II metal-dependent hydrolase